MRKPTTTPKKPLRQSKKPWIPQEYQKKALKFLVSRLSAGLLLDPGLGKTSITLAGAKLLLKQKKIKGVLVVAPLRVAVSTWLREVNKWEDFKDLDAVVLHGKYKEVLAAEKHQVYVINYEGLAWLIKWVKKGKVRKAELTPAGKALFANVDCLVWDELSKMKHTDTNRFKLIKPHLKRFKYKWGLTGSPASNGLENLFGQCFVLDEGNTLSRFVTHFRAEFFRPIDEYGHTLALQPGAEERLHTRLRPLMLRMEAEDYIQMPTQLNHVVKYTLPDKVREQYTEIEDHFITVVQEMLKKAEGKNPAVTVDHIITAPNVASSKNKLRQICSGAVYLPQIDPITGEPLAGFPKKTSRQWAHLHDEKLSAFEDLVDELQGQQLLVAYDFNHDQERLTKLYPHVPCIGGGVSAAKGRVYEAQWNAGELPLLFIHPQSGAHGLNLQESNAFHVAWFTLTWDFELYDQLIRRLRRQGNTAKHVHVYHFIGEDTVEESVMYTLMGKGRTQKSLLDALKTRQRLG